jgi:DNA invertase Pin-like site-specific DNA recombinase
LERLAVVYVRQSTMQPVLAQQESTRLPYGLVRRAGAWGWPAARVLVIDADLGRPGPGAGGRQGCQRLGAEVGRDHGGVILGVEMSRVARSSKDWHPLLEICVLFGTLIADLDGIYEPSQDNDRLLFGLNGTMSEAALPLLQQWMDQGPWQKARRGALRFALPRGDVHTPSGGIV